eukprot:g61304.t1
MFWLLSENGVSTWNKGCPRLFPRPALTHILYPVENFSSAFLTHQREGKVEAASHDNFTSPDRPRAARALPAHAPPPILRESPVRPRSVATVSCRRLNFDSSASNKVSVETREPLRIPNSMLQSDIVADSGVLLSAHGQNHSEDRMSTRRLTKQRSRLRCKLRWPFGEERTPSFTPAFKPQSEFHWIFCPSCLLLFVYCFFTHRLICMCTE